MFWGLDGNQWLQLWSGTIGAFVAALIGGFVALGVVRLTNGQQRKIAAEAREINAISEIVSQLQVLALTYQKPEEFQAREQMAALFAAVVKLHMAGPSVKDLAEALGDWPGYLVDVCGMELLLRDNDGPKHPEALSAEVSNLLSHAGGTTYKELRDWHLDSKEDRLRHLAAIRYLKGDVYELHAKIEPRYQEIKAEREAANASTH